MLELYFASHLRKLSANGRRKGDRLILNLAGQISIMRESGTLNINS